MKLNSNFLLCAAAMAAFLTAKVPAKDVLENAAVFKPEFLHKHAVTLGLTEDQVDKMKHLLAGAKADAATLEAAVNAGSQALNEALRQEPIDEKLAKERLDAMLKSEAELKHLQLKVLLGLRAMLTPEQLTKASKLLKKPAASEPAPEGLEAKAQKLKQVVEDEFQTATSGMKRVGERIKSLAESGKTEEAEKEIDRLAAIMAAPAPKPDFASSAPGETEISSLQSRYEAVKAKADECEDFALLRELLAAKASLDAAKDEQNAEKVGRILTWAEGKLGK